MNKTHIAVVLDRSGSMNSVRDDAIGGFNTFLSQQQALPGEASMTVAQFDHEYLVTHANKPLRDVPPLNTVTYAPRGMTALYDAIGRTVDTVGAELAALPASERPAKVLMLIITDGFENSSREYSGARIREMIAHQREKYSWEFIFIGSDEKAIGDAQKTLGMQTNSTRSYRSANEVMTKGLIAASAGTFSYRASNQAGGGQSLGGYDDSLKAQVELQNALQQSQKE